MKLYILIQAVLVTIVLLARYGNDGLRLQFGVDNTDFLGVGTSLGLALIVPLILLAYILGGSLFVMVSGLILKRDFIKVRAIRKSEKRIIFARRNLKNTCYNS